MYYNTDLLLYSDFTSSLIARLDNEGIGELLVRSFNAMHDDYRIVDLIKQLLECSDQDNLPIFNINRYIKDNKRLIDLVPKEIVVYKELITLLRTHGSVEPQDLIVLNGKKLDLSNRQLDEYLPNKEATINLLDLLYATANLTDTQINEIIEQFKARDFDDLVNTDWDGGVVKTIPQVVDALVALGDVDDRLNKSWNFKKVLAYMIHVIDTSPNDNGLLYTNLTHRLSGLFLCHLGKLMNLLYVVQDELVVGTKCKDINFITDGIGMINFVLDDLTQDIREEKAKIAFASLFFEHQCPANEHSVLSNMFRGALNKIMIDSDGANIESGPFNSVDGQIIRVLPEQIALNKEIFDLKLIHLQNILNEGIILKVTKMLELLPKLDDEAFAKKLNFGAMEYFIGEWAKLPKNIISNCYDAIKQQKGIEFAKTFAQAVLKTSYVSDQVKICLMQNLISDGTKENIEFLIEQAKSIVIDHLWIKSLDEEKHTLLSELAHKEAYGSELAKSLLQTHEAWNDQIHHEESLIGAMSDNFGELL